jgi:trans-aconitate methyltransferase
VTAVDESAEMLDAPRERVTGAETVRSPIESLRLERRFDVVMLASYLVHTAEHRTRQALLETCRRHVRDDGCVLIQREGEVWHRSVRAKDGTGRCRASARILAAARYGSCRPRPPEAAATWQ